MARVLVEAPLTTPAARAKLPRGLHWRGIDADVHLGYRKGARAGRWLARWRVKSGGYKQETLGAADDALTADGNAVLSFHQAVMSARKIVEQRRADEAATAAGPALTVRDALNDYISEREARELGTKRDCRSRLGRHVMSDPIADKPLHNVRKRDLMDWRTRLPDGLAPNTIRRTVNDFKAALNRAARSHDDRLPPDFPMVVRNGLAAPDATAPIAREAQILSDAEVRAIIQAAREIDHENGWDGDLARLVIVLAATGARFSQIARMTVADVQDGRLLVPTSRKGRALKQRQRVAIRVGEDVSEALKPATIKRHSAAPLLERWRWVQTTPTVWERDRRGPWSSSSELTRPWALVRDRTGLSTAVPYSLRHSSIVRGLRAGLPVRLVASLHDTSSQMIERHYSAFITDALDELAAAAVVPLIPARNATVIELRRAAKRRRS